MTGLILSAVAMMGPGMGQMGQGGPGMGMLMNPKVQQELGLSQDQIDKIQKISDNTRLKTIDLQAELAKMHLQMRQMMRSDKPDQKAIDALIQKMSDKRAEIQKIRVEAMLQIRQVLTEEQFQKFQSMKPPFKAQRGKGHGQGHPKF